MKKMFSILSTLALLFLCALPAQAQTQTATVVINYTQPTTGTQGEALTGASALTKAQFWLSTTAGIPDTAATTTPTAVQTPIGTTENATIQASVGQRVYVRMNVCSASACGGLTNEASGVVTAVIPGLPNVVTITIKVT